MALLFVAGCAASPPREAVLTRATEGDRACYLQVEGAHQALYASFDVCPDAQRLLGHRVRFRYEEAEIQAASCEGDPSCPRTERVRLVVAVEEAR